LLESLPGAVEGVELDFSAFEILLDPIENLKALLENIDAPLGAFKLLIEKVDFSAFDAIEASVEAPLHNIRGILEGLPGLLELVGAAVPGLIELMDLGPVAESLAEPFESIIAIIEGIPQVVETTMSYLQLSIDWAPIIESIVAPFAGLWAAIQLVLNEQQIIEGVASIFQEISDDIAGEDGIIPKMVTTLVGIFGKLPKVLADEANKKISELEDLGKEIVKGIRKGIEDSWDEFIGWVLGKLGSIVQSTKDFFGMESPSKVFAEIGTNMVDGLRVGWSNSFGSLQREINNSIRGIQGPGGLYGMGLGGLGGAPGTGAAGAGGSVQHVEHHNYHINSAGAAALTMAIVEQQREERLNVFMGG
jgi:hypothetical protein